MSLVPVLALAIIVQLAQLYWRKGHWIYAVVTKIRIWSSVFVCVYISIYASLPHVTVLEIFFLDFRTFLHNFPVHYYS